LKRPVLRHLPNALTAFRLFAAPVLVFLLLHERYEGALVLFALAGLSDALDGYLAKRFAFGSRFGAILDPAADKLLMLVAFVTLVHMDLTPFWLTALVIGRDIAIVAGILLGRALALPIAIAPLAIGKASTVVQVCYVGLVLLLAALGQDVPTLRSAAEITVALVTVASWLAYGQVLLKAFALRRKPA
jgi:cardiolipin synthase